MAWTTPKTDWSISYDSDGNYTGDRFNASDFNRIKDNLVYLNTFAKAMYEDMIHEITINDKNQGDFFHVDDINQIENLFAYVVRVVPKANFSPTVFTNNGKMINYTELNTIESAMLDAYNKLTNQSEGRRTLTWNFGMKGGL